MSWSPPRLPIVLLDVDGVLADFVTPMLEHTNAALRRAYSKDDVTEHDIEDCLRLTSEERTRIRKRIDKARMSRHMSVLPGAVEGVQKLSEISEVFFITASLTSSQTWEWDRRAWLDDNFGDGFGKRAQFVKHKYLVQGDIFIDDSIENVEKWSVFNQQGTAIIWDQWYNKDLSIIGAPIIRGYSWAQVEGMVRLLTARNSYICA